MYSPLSTAAEPFRVAFLGPLASFSHQAALGSFGSDAVLLPQTSFGDAFALVQADEADYATIPIENSSNGAVVQNLDILADRNESYPDITVCGEYYLPVHHCLLVKGDPEENKAEKRQEDKKYKDIKKLYTHTQAWDQCASFLAENFSGVERQDVSSTSKAAEIVANEQGNQSAAIASKFAGDHHGLVALAENIEDDESNTTRFLIIRNSKSKRTRDGLPKEPAESTAKRQATKRKTLISFLVDHHSPGALADALVIFKRHGLNLTTINSRPGGIRPWQYVFLVECQRSAEGGDDDAVAKAMHELQAVTERSRDLGSWDDQLSS